MLVFSFIILLSVDYRIALCSVAILPILFIYSFIFIKQVRVKYRETDEAEAVVTGKIEETINSVRVIKAYNNERLEIKKFDEDLNRYGHKYIKWRRLSALYHGTSDIFIFLTIVASSLLSAILCFNKDISLGTMVITSTYTTMVVWPIRDCATTLADLARAFVSIDRMNNILNTKTEDIDEGLTPEIKGNIEFKDITFRYEDSTKDCLKDINLSIKSKQTIAIMGKTGSGKSTLALLLTRLFDYQSGSIKIDGVELKDISKRHIRQNVATVLQEPFLFSRSVYDNLTIAHQDINKEEVIKATKIAHVDEAINTFKDGYSSEIGEKGTTISGGQKQRITIARTILTKAPIVIFDDSLSAVDAETDNKIRSALKHHNDATTIIITHRINTAKDADMIVVLDNGMISEIGTHDDLIAKNGFYNHIYELQERNE